MRCGALKENRKSLPVDASHELTVVAEGKLRKV